jgi:hypothetical protein
MAEEATLERFHPLLVQTLLNSVRRFEPDFYAHLCRAFHLDADRMIGLFREVEASGPGQLMPLLRELRAHQSYHDIVYLAGRNSLHAYLELEQVRIKPGSHDAGRFVAMAKQLLPSFTGLASFSHMLKGELHFFELRDSVFAREATHDNPTCGFYAGFLGELGTYFTEGTAVASEVRCCANDPEAVSCLVRVNL